MIRFAAIFILLMATLLPSLKGQIAPYEHANAKRQHLTDTAENLQQWFRKGHFYGHGRNFFSSTINQNTLSDYYALGVGGGIGYHSAHWNGFSFGISGFFIYNLKSSDLASPDPQTGALNRYEVGLFDHLNPNNHHDLDRLEDLFIQYERPKLKLTFGKQHIISPLINPQDGRMRPTLVDGLLLNWKASKHFSVDGGVLGKISPRGTVSWFNIGQSMGIYPQGRQVDGTPSDYANNIKSDFIALLGTNYKLNKFDLKTYNYFVDNVMHVALLQLQYTDNASTNRWKPFAALQAIRQDAINHGGNYNQKLAYLPKGSVSHVFSGRIGVKSPTGKYTLFVNATRIPNGDRFVFPREWGRDAWFTFIPRERAEGNADYSAVSGWASLKVNNALRIDLAQSFNWLAPTSNAEKNKYAMPSYGHTMLDARYVFQNQLKGADIQLLYVFKNPLTDTFGNDRLIINKVNMHLINVVLNYHF